MKLFLVAASFCVFCFSSLAQNDIFTSARSGNAEAVAKLYQFNPDTINSLNDQGYSPLILACYYNQLEVIELLLSFGVDLEEKPSTSTALQATCFKGFDVATGLLLDYGANPNIADKNGTSPLIYATQFNHVEIVQMLKDNGANLNYKDPNGLTALDYAQQLKNQGVIDVLTEN